MRVCVDPHPSFCRFSLPAAPNFLGNLRWIGGRHWAVALSPAIAALCQEAGFGQITTAAQPNRQAMVAVITPLMDVKSG